MNVDRHKEEMLREASASGDEDSVKSLAEAGVDVNARHSLNGWTALHWASKRGHLPIVNYLLSQGADASLTSNYGETPFSVAKNKEIRSLLPIQSPENSVDICNNSPLPITPNYISNPPLAAKMNMQEYKNTEAVKSTPVFRNLSSEQTCDEELVLKVRTSDPPNQDFIEIEIPMKTLSFEYVFESCCKELGVLSGSVIKLRKLPNTIVRKDKDVFRFHNFQELELVLNSSVPSNPKKFKAFETDIESAQNNGFENISKVTGNNSPLMHNSNYCKNGEILY